MKEHRIEYTDHGILAKAGVFAGFCLLVIVLLAVLPVANEVALVSGLAAAISVSLVHLTIVPSRIRKTGVILVGYNRVVFGMAGKIEVVDLFELARYRIVHCDGTMLTLALKNGDTFRLVANNSFCDARKLERACRDIEAAIHKTQSKNMERENPETENLNA